MKNTASKALLGLIAMVALCPTVGLAQTANTTLEPPKEIPEFLAAWVAGDEQAAMSYFSTSERAMQLAPSSVLAGEPQASRNLSTGAALQGGVLRSYWKLMNEGWRHWADIDAGLSIVHDQELIQILTRELGVHVVSGVGDEYLAYIASSPESIEQFAHQGAAEILLNSGRRTLCVLADLPPRTGLPPPGPFVTFWQQENDEWRIQTIGGLQP